MDESQMEIRRATAADIGAVAAIYDAVNDHLAAVGNYNAPSWGKGTYPVAGTAAEALAEETLYVAVSNGEVMGSCILNHRQHDDYVQVPWSLDARDEEIWVVHTLVVHPQHRGMGVGRKLLAFAVAHCRASGARTIRLDTFLANANAQALYSSAGFSDMGVWPTFKSGEIVRMFEYIL